MASFAYPGRDCRDGLRSGPAFPASLNAGPFSPTSDRLRLGIESTLLSCLQDQAARIPSLSSRPVGQTGDWSKLAWPQVPRRSTPLPVPGKAGVSLRPAASLEGGGPRALHLCASVCICGQNLLGILDYANGTGVGVLV